MKGMILAAGFGTRLRPLTDHTPKPLLPVGGHPMIYYSLLLLKKYGISDVMINLHHHGEKIINALGDGSRFGMSISYSKEMEILGTGGGIKKVAAHLGKSAFIVINSDILIDINLDKLVSFHKHKKSEATLVLRKTEDPSAFGAIEMDAKDRIRNMLGKIDVKEAQQTRKFMFTGLHVMEPTVFDYIPSEEPCSIIDAYLEMLRAKEHLFGYVTKGYWNDLGQMDRYRRVNLEIEQGNQRFHFI